MLCSPQHVNVQLPGPQDVAGALRWRLNGILDYVKLASLSSHPTMPSKPSVSEVSGKPKVVALAFWSVLLQYLAVKRSVVGSANHQQLGAGMRGEGLRGCAVAGPREVLFAFVFSAALEVASAGRP